jgi:predicted PurR-regulated permease PerM
MTAKRENGLPDYRWMLLALAATGLLVYLLSPVLSPFLAAAILAYICNPLVDRLERLKLGRTLSTMAVMLLLAGVFLLLLLIVLPLLQKELLLIAQRLPAYIDALRGRIEPLLLQYFGIKLDFDAARLQQALTAHWQTAGDVAGKLLQIITSRSAALVGWMVNLLLVPVVMFYLLRDWPLLLGRIEELIPRRWHGKITAMAREIDTVLAEFLRGQLSVMLLMALFYSVGLWLTGLELALPIGLLAGLLGFVPYLGISTGIILATLAALLQFPTIGGLLPVLLVFGLGQVVEGILTPTLVGERIGLHPVAVIFALLAGGQLFGFTGVLLALPAGAALAVGLHHLKTGYLASETYQK